ncbi:E3 ubiquitin-protein ligase CSU1 [Dissostichus eleginoides]|uniref:E3 ubiquitin-protein ligase CSU1 n=1 Tax=Dissostichus eleginoides TaxID=100907 RepID=A0AAD9B426_DISEL|nr:E3 ubiquitin-protein ligase CSU1 [Dissostichus eleginoides]
MPMLTPDIFQPIINSFLNDCTNVSWQLLSDGKIDSDMIILLTRMCQEIIDTLTILILEATLPQVNKWMDWVEEENHKNACITASVPTEPRVYTQRTRTYDRVTEEDVEASFGNCLDCCFGMALGLQQGKTEQSQALLALFIVSITKRVNYGLQELTQPSSANSSNESVSSTDSQTEDIVYHIAHILRACMGNDKVLPSPQFSRSSQRSSCTFSDDETDIKKIMEAADQLLVLTDIRERSATPAGKPPQKSLEEEEEEQLYLKTVLEFLSSESENEASMKPESLPQKSAEEEAEDDEELKVVLDFLASESENEASMKPESLPQKSAEEEAEDDEELKVVLDFLASESENEASMKPESLPKRSAKEEEEERLYLETAAEFLSSESENYSSMKPENLPKKSAEQEEENERILKAALEFLASEGENYSSMKPENLPQKSAEQEEENERILKAALEFLASEGENYTSIERENLPQKAAEKLEKEAIHYSLVHISPGEIIQDYDISEKELPLKSGEKLEKEAIHYSLANISPGEIIQDYDISGEKSEVSLPSSLVVEASDSFRERRPLKSEEEEEEELGSERTSPSSSLFNETSNSYDEELPQQRRKGIKKGKKKADYSSTETSDGGTQQRYNERYQDEEDAFYSEEELLIKQHRTCLTVFLVKLLDRIATPNQTIYHSDFEGMLERLRMKTDTIGFATLLRTRENIHIPVYKDLVKQFGSAEEIQSAIRYKSAIFEKAVSTTLKENLWKCSQKTRSTAVRRKTKKRVKQLSTDSEMNTSSVSEEFEWVVGSTPLPQKKNKKKCLLCRMIGCVTKFFRKVFK